MKFSLILFLISLSTIAQVNTELIESTQVESDSIINKDYLGNLYTSHNNSISKIQSNKVFEYSNIQLGKISSLQTFNALKPLLFYKDFNTFILLDNRLSERAKIDFNTLESFKNVSHASLGYENTIWVFNQNTLQLELFDYINLKDNAKSNPITSKVLGITSDYNNCWLLTTDYILLYNYFGSLLFKTKNDGFSHIALIKENAVLRKENDFYLLNKKTGGFEVIDLPKHRVKSFFVINQNLYIYQDNTLFNYQLKF